MMKFNILLSFLLFVFTSNSQVFVCKDGLIKFTSEAPLELIKAQSSKASGALDCSNKNVLFMISIDSFDGFNSSLQKEHFRENYMETSKFPTAIFKGKIIEDVDFNKNGTYNVRAKGIFTIHGVEKEKIVKVKIIVNEKTIEVETSFEVALEDHNINIPKVVNQKIASMINVELKAIMKPKS
jgi:polyisoprenoid-binding protein YceI